MDSLSYRLAFERIRAEYVEMPGMALTLVQVQRLSGVDVPLCKVVLDDLTRACFLHLRPDGSYARGTEDTARLRMARASASVRQVRHAG
jgi:hypothetical protein